MLEIYNVLKVNVSLGITRKKRVDKNQYDQLCEGYAEFGGFNDTETTSDTIV